MATDIKCPHCGKSVPSTALGGICPECMLKAGLADTGEVGPDGTLVASSPPPPIPRIADLAPHFPQLEILECLGRGGMGAVYKARQPKLDRFVALKILSRKGDSNRPDAGFAQRFEREARALARLNHPDIVAVYDFGAAGGFPYLLMEYVDGVTLRELLRTRRLSPEEALAIVPKICEALQFAHERGIVHRDIKPENILVDKQGRVKIADFGIAKIINPLTASEAERGAEKPSEGKNLTQNQVLGTPHYMAPEQIEQPAKVDHRADIFSLGVVFYEMLTGELPLGKFAPPSRKVQVDVRLDEIVLHALEKEPERRYQHANEVKTDVETIASGPREAEVRSPKPTAARPEPESSAANWIVAARWTARALGTLLLAFYAVFILAEGLPPIASQPEGVQLNFVAVGLMLGGFIVGWKREGTAALLIASGWTLWQVSEGRMQLNLFQTPLPVAALYAACWWATRGRRTGVLALATAILALGLGLGWLIVPTNVFVQGRVVDSATGLPVRDVELRLPQHPNRAPKNDAPNARTDQAGHYQLHVGWYAANRSVTLSAAGYGSLTTNLGPRELAQRRINRDFVLTPSPGLSRPTNSSPNAMPPVVIETFPASGSAEVDPGITELRATFSKPVFGAAWCRVDNYSVPETTGSPRYVDERTCVLPVRLQPSRVYALWLNTEGQLAFRDRENRPAMPYLLIFQTRN